MVGDGVGGQNGAYILDFSTLKKNCVGEVIGRGQCIEVGQMEERHWDVRTLQECGECFLSLRRSVFRCPQIVHCVSTNIHVDIITVLMV